MTRITEFPDAVRFIYCIINKLLKAKQHDKNLAQ